MARPNVPPPARRWTGSSFATGIGPAERLALGSGQKLLRPPTQWRIPPEKPRPQHAKDDEMMRRTDLPWKEPQAVYDLIMSVPDVDDPLKINFWHKSGTHYIYIEGWADQCLAGTGFGPFETGDWERKMEYLRSQTFKTLANLEGENRWGIDLVWVMGGFHEFEPGVDRDYLYGVTWGIFAEAPGF